MDNSKITVNLKEAIEITTTYAKRQGIGTHISNIPFNTLLYGLVSVECITKHIFVCYGISKLDMSEFILGRSKKFKFNFTIEDLLSEITDKSPEIIYLRTDVISSYLLSRIKEIEDKEFEMFLKKYNTSIDKIVCDLTLTIPLTSLYFDNGNCIEVINELDKENFKKSTREKMTNSNKNSKQNHDKKLKGNDESILEKFAVDLTKEAMHGNIGKVIGRDEEMERAISILNKCEKNNPILIGEPGVGKTALVEGLARKIFIGDVPSNLKDKRIFSLNLNSLVAGTKYRGDFEERLKQILDVVTKTDDIIVFIDEIHMMLKSGASTDCSGMGDIIKPYLARGKMRLIGATTLNEFKSTIEKDGALERRFQPIIISEPTKDETMKIIKGSISKYESYHKIKINDEIIEYAIDLSIRYIPERNLPDKAFDLIDEASSLIKSKKNDTLYLDKDSLRKVVAMWKKISLFDVDGDIMQKIRNAQDSIISKIIGQDEAVNKVMKALKLSSFDVVDYDKPKASFLFVGPTGVGKTYLARLIAENFVVGRNSVIKLDMSEYMDKISINKIIGSPPGYVGFDDTLSLAEQVRRNPESVIVFDEIDKAHSDIYNILLQILDEGTLTDASSRKISFKQSIIILTANISSYTSNTKSVGFNSTCTQENDSEVIKSVKKIIKPEIIDRLTDVVVFKKLDDESKDKVLKIEIADIKKNFKSKGYWIKFDYDMIEYLTLRFSKMDSVREIKSLIKNEIYPSLIDLIVDKKIMKHRVYLIKYDSASMQIYCEIKNEKVLV